MTRCGFFLVRVLGLRKSWNEGLNPPVKIHGITELQLQQNMCDDYNENSSPHLTSCVSTGFTTAVGVPVAGPGLPCMTCLQMCQDVLPSRGFSGSLHKPSSVLPPTLDNMPPLFPQPFQPGVTSENILAIPTELPGLIFISAPKTMPLPEKVLNRYLLVTFFDH